MEEIYELTAQKIGWIIAMGFALGMFFGFYLTGGFNNQKDIHTFETTNCTIANNNYAMFQFIEEEPMAQHKIIKLAFTEDCHLQNVFEWVEDENRFKTIYFRGY